MRAARSHEPANEGLLGQYKGQRKPAGEASDPPSEQALSDLASCGASSGQPIRDIVELNDTQPRVFDR